MSETVPLPVKWVYSFSPPIMFVLCALLVVLANGTVSAKVNEQAIQDREINLVWSANHGQGEQVFFSNYQKNTWSIPVQISDSEEHVFQPVSSVGDDGKIWIVWTGLLKNKRLLQFSVYDVSSWSKPRQIDTGMDDNRAATLIIDIDNTPWIAWTATDESYSDVFWSRWNGKNWDVSVKAHSDNSVPDTHPALAVDESGHVVLSWQTYADGKYITVSQRWDGEQWQGLSHVSAQTIRKQKKQKSEELPEIPTFIKERYKAKIFIKDTIGAGAVPLSQF